MPSTSRRLSSTCIQTRFRRGGGRFTELAEVTSGDAPAVKGKGAVGLASSLARPKLGLPAARKPGWKRLGDEHGTCMAPAALEPIAGLEGHGLEQQASGMGSAGAGDMEVIMEAMAARATAEEEGMAGHVRTSQSVDVDVEEARAGEQLRGGGHTNSEEACLEGGEGRRREDQEPEAHLSPKS